MTGYLSTEELVELFNTFEQVAFRAELLQHYDVPEERESFARWKRGEPISPAETDTGWQAALRGYQQLGRSVQRVRVVNGPLTDYQRNAFEWWYPHNSAAGEDIRIIDLARTAIELPPQDFWMFDDRTVALVDYDDNNEYVGARRHTGDTEPYRHWREELLRASTPWRQFEPIKG